MLANLEALAELLQASDGKAKPDLKAAPRPGSQRLLFEAMNIVQESKEGMARIHRIVRDLRAFSRLDEDATLLTDVNAAVDSALSMLRSELRYRAQVERDLRATRRRACQRRPTRAGVSQPDHECRACPGGWEPQAQPALCAQL